MSLNEERMMILKMVQEGKITSDEAAKLLEALDASQPKNEGYNYGYNYNYSKQQKSQVNFNDEVAKFRERINEWRKDFANNYNQKDFDKVVDEFSAKAEKVGKNVASATVGFVDKIVDYVGTVVDTGSFSIFGSSNVIEKTYEAAAAEGMDLEVEALNGQIVVKKHEGDRILIKSRIRCPQNFTMDVLTFEESPSAVKLALTRSENFNLSVSHEVYLPTIKLNKLKLESKNGKIHVEDTISKEFESITKNAAIDLMGVNSENIKVDTKNAKVFVNYVIGKDISINTKNSIIEIRNLKAEKLGAFTANGRILADNIQAIEGSSEISLDMRTKNGEIKVNMNDTENKGYRVSARTTNGGINLLIPELLYHNGLRQEGFGKNVDAESSNYSNAPVRVNINAETVNGYIEVVK